MIEIVRSRRKNTPVNVIFMLIQRTVLESKENRTIDDIIGQNDL
jgi:hypothetical protein